VYRRTARTNAAEKSNRNTTFRPNRVVQGMQIDTPFGKFYKAIFLSVLDIFKKRILLFDAAYFLH